MYYKITNGARITLADKLEYIRELPNGTVVRCRVDNANGITLNGVNYHLDGCPAFPEGDYETVTATEISRTEYLALADALGVEVAPKVEDVPILREQVKAQTERNDMLEECLLEMSQEVYK